MAKENNNQKRSPVESEILALKNEVAMSLSIQDEDMRDLLLDKIYDMIEMPFDDYCKKYDINKKTYMGWRRNFVIYFGIEPRVLFTEQQLSMIKELHPYIDDEKLKLSIEDQLSLPTSLVDNEMYIAKKKTIEVDGEGKVRRIWLKNEINQANLLKTVINSIKLLCDDVKPLKEIKPPKINNKDLLTFYPLADLHIGLLISGDETNHGIDFDLHKGKEWVLQSINYLIENSPDSETAIVTDLGDLIHSASDINRTFASGHPLDVSHRHSKVIQVTFELIRVLLEKALAKHKTVYFYAVPGNHDDYISLYISNFIAAWFRDNPRLIVVGGMKVVQYHIFGKTIIGMTHGHSIKPEKSSDVFLYDNQEHISFSKYRYFHFGHFHNNKVISSPLVKIEVHSTPVPLDYYSDSHGYRAMENYSSKAIVYHKELGEISRINFALPIK